ncbi:DUF5805 domain-containing protein [Natronococcus sp. A-GB1]|uniref:DUF5805 domain-containing protein n=1 Tax=Natronococcus sp. A-GB1 TaxID=3037648 RepID=UPI00241C0946|nr:DUF5805 domain-containing protein [Natronococcus sp. A-GB1]MDG5762072.1 DUF5805 domain-containing protein [Natronococcus sp. A-GB1]
MVKVSFEVPDEWVEAADDMDVSVKEYCSRMIRAGRRQFGYDYTPKETPVQPKSLNIDDTASMEDELKEWVYRNLSTTKGYDEEELLGLLEDDIIEAADNLCDEGRAKYRRTSGGWLKVDIDE